MVGAAGGVHVNGRAAQLWHGARAGATLAAQTPQRSLLGKGAGARGQEDRMSRGRAVAPSGPAARQPQALAFTRSRDLWAQVVRKASSDMAPDTY